MQEIHQEINSFINEMPENILLNKSNLKAFLSSGMSQILNKTNQVERELYLETSPEKGYSH